MAFQCVGDDKKRKFACVWKTKNLIFYFISRSAFWDKNQAEKISFGVVWYKEEKVKLKEEEKFCNKVFKKLKKRKIFKVRGIKIENKFKVRLKNFFFFWQIFTCSTLIMIELWTQKNIHKQFLGCVCEEKEIYNKANFHFFKNPHEI